MIISNHFLDGNASRLNVREIQLSETKPNQPKLIFLHDALGCIASWKSFPQQLCSALKMDGLVYEREGHGQSSASLQARPLDYLRKEALEVLPILLSHFNIEAPILVGCSDGASIALYYGARYPDLSAIISIAGHIKVEEITIKGIRNSLEKLKRVPTFKKLERLHGDKTQTLIRAWADVWLSDGFRDWNISPLLSDIQCPTLVLQGANDPYATRQQAKDIASAIGQQAKVIILENLGHFPHLEQAEMVIGEIKTFLLSKLRDSYYSGKEI